MSRQFDPDLVVSEIVDVIAQSHPIHQLQNYSQALYVLLDSFSLNNNAFEAVLVTEATVDLLQVPEVEPLLRLVPPDPFLPSVIYYRDDFWMPILSCFPEKNDICTIVYGENSQRFGLDIIYRVGLIDGFDGAVDLDEAIKQAQQLGKQYHSKMGYPWWHSYG
jgi:hypothetical protein